MAIPISNLTFPARAYENFVAEFGDPTVLSYKLDLLTLLNRNRLINQSPGDILQRQNPATLTARSDDTYGADRKVVLTQTSSVQSQRIAGDLQKNAWRLKQNQAAAQRFGTLEIIEGINCFDLRNKSVVFSGRIRISDSQPVRFAILEWTGTEDSVTSDVANDWASATYTPGNFFLAANLEVTNVGSFTPAAATWDQFELTGVVGASMNNLICFLWTEGTAAQNFTLDIEEFGLNSGLVALPFVRRPITQEIILCQRYFEKSYDLDTVPASITTNGAEASRKAGVSTTALNLEPVWQIKRISPTVTLYSTNDGATGVVFDFDLPGNRGAVASGIGQSKCRIDLNGAITSANLMLAQWTADSEL